MLHLRAVSRADQTDAAIDVLRKQSGTTHVAVLRGAAVQPAGDVIEADLAREAADELLAELCALGLDHTGGITLTEIDTSLSDAADAAEKAAPGQSADAVVWEELLARTGEESKLNATFLAFLTLACLIAGVGVVTNSPVTIVGAMVVGPEFGPLSALAVGLVRRRWDLARRAVVALLVGFPIAMVITGVATLGGIAVGLLGPDTLAQHNQVDFVYQVGPFSLIVALFAGAAGMLSITSSKSAALVGVFISVTTVPAAGYAVVAATLGEWLRCAESVAQLAVNLSGIVLAAALVLLLQQTRQHATDAGRPLTNG